MDFLRFSRNHIEFLFKIVNSARKTSQPFGSVHFFLASEATKDGNDDGYPRVPTSEGKDSAVLGGGAGGSDVSEDFFVGNSDPLGKCRGL